MDPLTGFSRRTILLLGLVFVVGIAASTVATVLQARGDPGCPDRAYGCAVIEPGEPVRLGVLFSTGSTAIGEVRRAIERRPEPLMGHHLEVAGWDDRCSTEGGAEGARELVSDPPDGPSVVGVIGASCPAAALPAAQILSDHGIVLLSTEHPGSVPTRPAFHLSAMDLSPGEVAEAMLGAVERVAVQHEGDLLVPRTQLREALLKAGLSPASEEVL